MRAKQTDHKVQSIVKCSSTKLFSRNEMLRFARYVDDGRRRKVKEMFRQWYNGPAESGRGHTDWK